ncbi:MAG: BACON domain-containing protein [Bacteroidetes bacterium]|uniref:BACON domain-containing protein n=1 Tax=Candidatus Cryptobacteroides excrementavium TaxID=2840759 RepID=A0A9D9J266_9BACT|nr:BACON domain-containing protein [Candidatus Cryptobacteroides excrementavium]
MKTFKLLWVFSLLSVALISVSCQKTEETVIKIDLTVTGEGTFDFTSEKGSETFDVTSNVPWEIKVTSEGDWLSVDPMSGDGGKAPQAVTISVKANDTGDPREGSIVITPLDGDKPEANIKTLTVKQTSSCNLTVDPEELEFETEGDETGKTFTVTSNVAWKVTVPEEAKWLTVTTENNDGTGEGTGKEETVTVTAIPNDTGVARQCKITITPTEGENPEESTKTVTIKQKASVSLVLSTETLEFTHEETPLTFTVTSNAPWTVTFENTDGAEVIRTVSPETGEASEQPTTVTVTPWANTTDAERNATITVTASLEGEEPVVKTIQVTQTPTSDTPLYFNNFDKTAVSSDTELSGNDAWHNEDPDVIGNYSYSGVLVSADSPSSGSGANNIFFDQVSYFQTPAIIVNTSSAQNFVLTFSIYADTFDKNAFEVYLSGDGNNWLKVDYEVDGASGWMNASASFRVLGTPTNSMYLYFATSEPGKYRLDDLKLANTAAQQQNVIRFPGEIQFGGTKEVSVEQFLAEKPNLMGKYSLTGKVTAVNGEDVTISDDGTTTVVLKSLDLNGLAETLGEGDEVTVVGYRNVAEDGTACMSDGVLEEYTKAGSGEEAATGDELLISEYVCTENGECYIEIYNPTDHTITMSASNYSIAFYDSENPYNYATTCFLPDKYDIPSHKVIVFCSSNATWDGEKVVLSSLKFDGNDNIELQGQYGRPLDRLGQKGVDFGVNKTLRRKLTIGNPNSTWTTDEWEEISPATLDGLGKR